MASVNRIPAAVVGFGRFGRLHALRLRSHPQFKLECVVDICAAARDRARKDGFIALDSLDDIPDHVRIATVTTTSHTHADVAIQLMRRGLDVLVEKPLATSEAEIDALLDVAQQTGRILCTGHIERFNTRNVAVTSALHESDMEFRRFASARNTGKAAVLDLMVHDLDLAAYCLGLPPDEEIEIFEVKLGDHAVEARVNIGGISLRFCASYCAHTSRAEIHCSNGARILLAQQAPINGKLREYPGEDALSRQYSAFHALLSGNASSIADGLAGAAATRRALAILRAL